MAKFKVGDKVRVIDNPRYGERRYMNDGVAHNAFTRGMVEFAGKVVTIRSLAHDICGMEYIIEEDNGMWFWVDGMFSGLATEEPRREFIVIRRDGAKTIAELRHDREVIKSAVATCSEKDTFDFETGAKIAFDRLMGREEPKPAPSPEPPKYVPQVGDRVVTKFGTGTVVIVDRHVGVWHDEWNSGHNFTLDLRHKGYVGGHGFFVSYSDVKPLTGASDVR